MGKLMRMLHIKYKPGGLIEQKLKELCVIEKYLINLKEFYWTTIRPIMPYGSKCWALKEQQKHKVKSMMIILR